ncbi:DUF4433 domain-containing protein [Ralstonia nicotianae]
MPIANLASIMQHGILSYEAAAALPHCSVAMQPVQDRRDAKQVPQGLPLHQYANLYFHARNPMMSARRNEAGQLCVLRVSVQVLRTHGTVIADQNAASKYVRFLSPAQIDTLNYDRVYALDWRDDDRIAYWQKKAARCAEVLVPHVVPPQHIFGAYVYDQSLVQVVKQIAPHLDVSVDAEMFFS